MAYGLIAVDLDDTLLTNERIINLESKEALYKAADLGIIVVLCTGRTMQGAQRFYDDLGLGNLIIVSGGAEIFDPQGNALYTQNLDPALVKKLLAYAYENDIYANAYIDGVLVYREKTAFTESYEKRYGHSGIEMPDILTRDIITPKVVYYTGADRMASVRETVNKKFSMLSIRRSFSAYLEFSPPDVSKGNALKLVAEHYGIERKDVIAFGDAEIDIPMLEYAGLGVAVENGDPEAKKAADIICASNDDAGIADIINKYILEGQK